MVENMGSTKLKAGTYKLVDKRGEETTQKLGYRHIYRLNFSGEKPKHMCLQWQNWCWPQALRHPWEAMRYLWRRANR